MKLGAHLLDLAANSSALVRDTLKAHGDRPLSEYLGSLVGDASTTIRPPEDFLSSVRQRASALYDPETAQAAVAELRANPIVPTSNHFGVDTFADSIHGTLLFALRPRAVEAPPRTVVVLGFSSISLNNLTYPMGLLLYDPKRGDLATFPQRLPIMPNRLKHCAVAAAPRLEAGMVDRARTTLRRMAASGDITPFGERSADQVLQEDFAAPEILSLPSHAHQATRINTRLWRKLFRDGTSAPRLVQLPVEPICADLLCRDLGNPESLAHTLLFTARTRDALLTALDGARGCWSLDQPGQPSANPAGTTFFWALTDSGRRVALTLRGPPSALRLSGTDPHGTELSWEFTPEGVTEGLREGRLFPSLFSCFLTLAFARGLRCVGGYYQAEYLPVMQQGVIEALSAGGAPRPMSELVARTPTNICLAGLQASGRVLADGRVIPAGPVEIAGAGGFTEADIAAMQTVTVRDAYLLAFPELFHHLVPGAVLPPGWGSLLAAENGGRSQCGVRLEGR
ncbi:hypothetical protein OG943_16615 [Amycolatopsis sp. NBC_00345]|uniref:hypothetical protein n=1 Tax=Amycolatopsis sp. NBC_00345 TaxID=2975955 RepID=UPI002E25B63D